mgnify:CR=1 FL=1
MRVRDNGTGETINHKYDSKGSYLVTLTVRDDERNVNNDSIWAFIETSNDPPNTPTVNGPLNGKAGTPYNYTFSAIDPDGDDLYYFIILM